MWDSPRLFPKTQDLVIGLWDRVVFYKERKTAASIDLMREALPIIRELDELQRDGILGPEQAELCKRKLLSGVAAFLKAGATIPEMEQHAYNNPRTLMAPEPRLLSPPANTSSTSNDVVEGEFVIEAEEPEEDTNGQGIGNIDNVEDLSEEERALLRKLAGRTRKSKPQDFLDFEE